MQEQCERAAFADRHRKYLGSSDAAAIVGLSPYQTPLHVYLAKVGELPDGDNPYLEWGRRLQQPIAMAYQDKFDRPVLPPERETQFHPVCTWMGASVDYITVTHDGKPCILEVKTSSRADGWGTPGTDEVPEGYYLQVQHQMAVTDHQHAEIAVLIRGSDFRAYSVPRDNAVIDKLKLIEGKFWDMVCARMPPPPDWSHPETPHLLCSMYAVDEGQSIKLDDPELLATLARYHAMRKSMTEADRELEVLKARIAHHVGSACRAELPGWQIKRRKVRRRSYTIPETFYTTMTVRCLKEEDDDGDGN